MMVEAWDSIRVLDIGNFCSLDHRYEPSFGALLRAAQNCVCLSDPYPMRRPTACSEQFISRGSETLIIFDEE